MEMLYDISNYKRSYVILKPSSRLAKRDFTWPENDYVKFDLKKKRSYICGHITTHDLVNFNGSLCLHAPEPGNIAILPDVHEALLKDAGELVRHYYIQVAIEDIEYIMIVPDTLIKGSGTC